MSWFTSEKKLFLGLQTLTHPLCWPFGVSGVKGKECALSLAFPAKLSARGLPQRGEGDRGLLVLSTGWKLALEKRKPLGGVSLFPIGVREMGSNGRGIGVGDVARKKGDKELQILLF